MKLLNLKIFTAIRGGDLKYLKQVFEISTDEEIGDLLRTRHEESVLVRRPSNGREVYVRRPTPLHLAVAEWYVEVLEYLCQFQQSLDEECVVDDITNNPSVYGGVTPLHLAALSGKLKMVQSLVKHGCSISKATELGDTALFEACFEGHQTIVRYLLENGADLSLVNCRKATCLMIASYADNAEIVKYLVERGQPLNESDIDGRNVLFYVVSQGRLDTLVYLLDNGAQVRPDVYGINILMEASHHGQMEIVKYIAQYRNHLQIDLDELDIFGRNVFFYTAHRDATDIFEFLLKCGVALSPDKDGRTVLMTALLKGNLTLTKYLVENSAKLGLDLNEKDQKGRNCLFYCITGGDLDMFEYLTLENNVRIENSDHGVTLLMQAVAKNKPNFVKHFLLKLDEYGIDVYGQDKDGWDSMMYAVASGHAHLFRLLASVDIRCQPAADGRSVLMQAASRGDMGLLRYIMDNSKEFMVYASQRDNDGWNALFYTIQGGFIEAFKFLIKRGAKVCAALNGATVLMESVDKNQPEFVSYLLQMAAEFDIDIHQRDSDGNNALFYAAAAGYVTIFQELLQAGCKIEHDNHQRTLIMQAALHGHKEAVRYLMENALNLGLDLNHKDNDGRNVLFYSIEGGHLDILEYLCDCGINPSPDNSKKTNLMQAARVGNEEIVRYLLKHSSDLKLDNNAVDEHGENALFYAARSKSLKIVNHLLEHGLQVTANNNGINVLSEAMNKGQSSIAQAILANAMTNPSAINGKDARGRTVLHHCVVKSDLETLRKLGRFYDPVADCDLAGTTLLMRACADPAQMETVRYLIEDLKVDIYKRDVGEKDALFYAVAASNLPAVEYLLKKVTSIHCDAEGQTLLMTSCITGNFPICQTLLQSHYGKDLVGRVDNSGKNGAHYCAIRGKDAVLRLVHSFGCDIDKQEQEGMTPIMFACRKSFDNCVVALININCDISILDNAKNNALHHCFDNAPSLKCIKLLLSSGIEVNQPNAEGVTPLMLACQKCSNSQITAIKYLLDNKADPVMQDNLGNDAFDYCPFDAEYVKALMRERAEMDPTQKAVLEKFKTVLCEEVELNGVLRGLLKEGIFTRTLNFEVMKRPAQARVAKLLQLLTTRGQDAFRALCKVLRDTGRIELSYSMLKEAYRKEQEVFW